ncbi:MULTISPECIES: FAD-dependent protein [unclassified Dehalobacter]|uniref:NAD(P)/FAD-dependent oxidoreductase n=1 Tax=unclassified Dehalobacter TaxID=2635733 RepID=UPI000E6C5880|nr:MULTISPECIES: FAD/NAD(P)-binding protein [unclassified Dehalobacter]RJE48322.1 FAD-dependent oxidoreductase [Dehalobacter sp. MCB1]TCX50390.1 FAD-dependent oxidoreductase [Dehalobacter sp. 14DCB1]TCX52370.1 FAD-dependent oxidoreductase [Dehalobacter sp. 12DCB1]
MIMKHYDIGIVGGGISGIMCAYELIKHNPRLNICIFEKGNNIFDRKCPLTENKSAKCANCPTCAIMEGFGGCGSFSDGKYNFTTEFGGWLNEYVSNDHVMDLIEYMDSILVNFGATTKRFSTQTPKAREIGKIALQNDLHLLQAEVKHLGTENNLKIMANIFNFLKEKIEIRHKTEITDISQDQDRYILSAASGEYSCDCLVCAVGRVGSEWFTSLCRKMSIPMTNNQIDLGVRVELPYEVFSQITDEVYEAKLHYYTRKYNDLVKTFCMNPRGHVVTENTVGVLTVNGHSYSDDKLNSSNTNFALLVCNKFTSPFNEPLKYGKYIATLSNMLGEGVIVQRFGDLVKGRRTNEKRMMKSFTKPTLQSANAGDLGLALPKRHLDNIIEMIYKLDKIAPGTANYDTLLYGVEVKFYSARPHLNKQLETKYPNFYAIGDGAGITRSLSQSAASGIYAARNILKKLS